MAVRTFTVLRLPRAVMALAGGFGLGVAGFVYQTVFRNPLASPDIIGVSSGASVGAAFAILFVSSGTLGTTVCAFAGGLAAVFLSLGLAAAAPGRSKMNLVLAGIAVHALAQTLLMLLKLTADPEKELASIEYWIMGSLAGVTQSRVWFPVPMVISCCAVIFALHRQAMLLSVEEDEARLLGVPVGRMRFLLLTLATLVVAAVVSVTGLISFVGLLAPHCARLLAGHNRRSTSLLSGLVGSTLLLAADTIAKTVAATELPVSIFTSLLGVPFFALPYYKAGEGDAVMFTVENLAVRLGDKNILQNVHFTIDTPRQLVGILGANGSGKTTLLNIIAGKEGYDEGSIVFRRDLCVGYLEQDPHYPEELTVLEACFHHGNTTVQLIKEYERCMETEGNPGMEDLLARMEHEKAWDYERKAKQILSQLKIRDFNQQVKHLSGGQLKRVALANVLITEPDFLILDEPTNHLDLDMTEWLEDYLRRGNISLLMVTHDRYFLDRVCSEIIEIDNKQVYSYKGNYSYYLEKRQERIEATNAEIARANNLYRTELEWMRRMPQARGHKARYREEAFYELEKGGKTTFQ